MSDAASRLRQVALFADLSDDDLASICAGVETVALAPGETLFQEGDPGDRAYVVVSGEVDIRKATVRRDAVLARRGAGEVIGEMALLQEEPRSATVRARSATELIAIPRSSLDDLLARSPSAARSLFDSLVSRMRETAQTLRHQERMAQLGTLTAGVAHELNNPASAIARAADRLGAHLDDLDRSTTPLIDDPALRDRLLALATALAGQSSPVGRDPLARADAEEELADELDRRGVADARSLAPALVDIGVTLDALRDLGNDLPVRALQYLTATVTIRRLAGEILEGSRRLSHIVGALRSHSYLDRAPTQDVDVIRGLDDTLTLLEHRTSRVRIVRDYADDVPLITAMGGELNQVWTNLIGNALDAVENVDDATVTVRARLGDGSVVVEIEDNGLGVPDDVRDRIFDAFVTTKPPGAGTGLGLPISYRIIVVEHDGAFTFESEPGRTIFRVELPLAPA